MVSIEIGFILTLIVSAIALQVSNRLKLPGSIGLILIGIIFGPSFLGLLETGEIIQFLANIGITILLFKVGLDSDLHLLKSKSSFAVGLFGLLIPWIMGMAITWLFGFPILEAFFVGVILSATSIGITVAIMSQLNVMDRKFARVIIGAAVIDDILGLLTLSMASGVVLSQKIDFYSIGRHIGFSFLIILVSVILGIRILSIARKTKRFRIDKSAADLLIIATAFLAAVLAERIGFSGIIGTFFAGLVISEGLKDHEEDKKKIERLIDPLLVIFSPLFFLNLGLLVNFNDLASGFWLGILLSIVAIISKYVGSYYPAKFTGMDNLDSMLVGFGMIPRGEVALIAGQLGLSLGVIPASVFSAVIIMTLITSILPPIIFLYLLSPTPIKFLNVEKMRWKLSETFIIVKSLAARVKERSRKRLKK